MQKTGGYARIWPLAHAKFASVWLCHSKIPAHFPNQISKGRHLNSRKHGRGCRLASAKKKYLHGLLHTSCPLVSCLVTEWQSTVESKLYPSVGSQIFLWRLHFLIQKFFLAACLQKTSSFARNGPLSHAKFASCI